jgi:hypothetical protein
LAILVLIAAFYAEKGATVVVQEERQFLAENRKKQ